MTELKEMNTMPTEEIMEVAEEIAMEPSFNWAKLGKIGIGAAVVAGTTFAVYKYVVKPRLAKRKEESDVIECTVIDTEAEELDSEN